MNKQELMTLAYGKTPKRYKKGKDMRRAQRAAKRKMMTLAYGG